MNINTNASEHYHICGVLVHARPGYAERVRASLLSLPGLEIHHVTPEGRFVVTIENEDARGQGETLARMHQLEGVLTAAMVYQYGDTDESIEQESLR